jgi:apolipoprotein N-acyltransferase
VAAPPRGWWPLFPVGVAFLTVALYGRGLRGRLVVGGLTGLVHYGVTLLWLNGFTPVGYAGVVVLESVLLAAAAGLAPTARSRRWSGGWWTLPATLTLLDAVQTRFPFDGFPLPSLVFSQLDGPFVLAAPLGGALLVTLLAAASGVALASLVMTSGARRLVASTGVGMFLVAALLADGVLVSTVATEPAGILDVAVVQGGGPRGLRAVFTDPSATTQRHLSVAGEITDSPDLVLLPETVIIVPGTIAASPADVTIGALARRLDAPVVVGVAEMEATQFRNAAVLWGADGRQQGRYEKEHRVPFGEYIPGRALLERVTDLTALVPRDALIGNDEALLQPADGPPLGVVISYEILFADRVREAVTAGGQIVLVPTNAASYVTEEVPAIELAAARLRAREFGRTVVQAAPTGYSAVVRADGEVTAVTELSAPALLRENVELRTGLTPYARLGDVPFVILAIVVLLAAPLTAAVRRRARRSRRSRRPQPGS